MSDKTPTFYPNRFEGKVAVITASTAGIGYEAARRIALEGGEVVLSSRKQDNVEKAVAQLQKELQERKLKDSKGKPFVPKVSGISCHVSSADQRKRLVEFSTLNFARKIDVLVSNAAVSPHYGHTIDTEGSVVEKIMDVNLNSSLYLVQDFKNHMNEGGNIVFVGSLLGYMPMSPIGMYAVSKIALAGLTRALAIDLYSENKIRVNCVAPGVIKTEFSRPLWEPISEARRSDECALGRVGLPEEVAGPIAFLCSNDASYITGETVVISGGVVHSRL
uniref:Dehydrogenase/reductase 4 n=1 Tax=Nephromyces sp. MMRI TaxID=2496275 RepID=A0A3Q8UC05_9APIC|nr:dehydrogenase/reductase 4 [Nephromyces sp. MMRI]AZL94614.1 dehydrogenase/reductase 4 [Nephromyces sp. MMRI]